MNHVCEFILKNRMNLKIDFVEKLMKTSIHVGVQIKHPTSAFLKIYFQRFQEEQCPHIDARDFQQTAYTCLQYQSSTSIISNRTVDAQFILYSNTFHQSSEITHFPVFSDVAGMRGENETRV